MPTDDHSPRPKRKDAALNTEKLVQAAREVFAQKGLSATLEDIARHAGVGVGTIYRNFSSKNEIIETLYDEAIDSALADVHEALEIDDPWEALVSFFEITATHQAEDRGLRESLPGHGSGREPSARTTEKLLHALAPVFDRAHTAGVLREGVTPADVWPIFAMLNSVYGMSATQPDLWRRYLALILDGLRASDRPALPVSALDPTALADAPPTAD